SQNMHRMQASRQTIATVAIAAAAALGGITEATQAATPTAASPTTPVRYERLTKDNAVLLIVDHQVGLYTGVRDIDTLQLKHNIVGLTKAAQALKVPVIVTTTTEKMWGPSFRNCRKRFRECNASSAPW